MSDQTIAWSISEQTLLFLHVAPSSHLYTPKTLLYLKLKLQAIVKDREDWHAAVYGVTESDMTQQLNKDSKTLQINYTPKHWYLLIN